MTEWGLPPEYIVENWTEAKLALMLRKRDERIQMLNEAMKMPAERKPKRVPLEQLFGSMPGLGYKKVN